MTDDWRVNALAHLQRCRFCIECGEKLEVVGRYQKGCPHSHILVDPTEDQYGGGDVVIVFAENRGEAHDS